MHKRHKPKRYVDLRRVLFKKKSHRQRNWPSGGFEPTPIRIWKVAELMAKINIDNLQIHDVAKEHWVQLVAARKLFEGVMVRVYCEREFNRDDADELFDPVEDDISSSSSGSPPSDDEILNGMSPPIINQSGEVECINLRAIQLIMRMKAVKELAASIEVAPLDGRKEWLNIEKADMGDEFYVRVPIKKVLTDL